MFQQVIKIKANSYLYAIICYEHDKCLNLPS